MNWLTALAGMAAMALTDPGSTSYEGCLDEGDPAACVVDLAVSRDADQELMDLIAAGAVDAAVAKAPRPGRRAVELAARIAAGQRPEVSALEAQQVLGLFSAVEFYGTGLPEDDRANWLWPIAMSTSVEGLDLREVLISSAGRSERGDLATRLAAEARSRDARNNDEKASFASAAAHMAGEWRVATTFMESGGDRADGYDAPGIWREIATARLRESYDAGSAQRVASAILEDDILLPWPMDDALALEDAEAKAELRSMADALVERGRRSDREPRERVNDFGLAAWALRAAGDRGGALEAAREGLKLVPEAVAEQGSLSSHNSWPVRELFVLSPDEAVASGYLLGWDRYQGVLEGGGTPDPAWIVDDPFGLVLGADLLKRRGDAPNARALLAASALMRPDADPQYLLGAADDLMMLAAVARDEALISAVARAALIELDREDSSSSAIQLAISWRAAAVELKRIEAAKAD
jgi:hypothetical protein